MTDEIYIAVSLEADEDQPVADICYRGVQWASLTLDDDVGVLTVHASEDGLHIPVAAALTSIEEAQRRLRQLGEHF